MKINIFLVYYFGKKHIDPSLVMHDNFCEPKSQPIYLWDHGGKISIGIPSWE
jgi:hypothetical protein